MERLIPVATLPWALAAAAVVLGLCAAHAREGSPIRVYHGLCDASAAVWLDAHTFAVADDEENILRIYQRDASSSPVATLDLSAFLQVDPKEPESDIEGAARLGDVIFWVTSHGRNTKAKERPGRQRFFATRIVRQNGDTRLEPAGKAYPHLLQDLIRDPGLRKFNLAAAARLAPKARGGLNIEGLAATSEGHLLLGFRNPIPGGRALVVPLLNPNEVIQGTPAAFGEPVQLDLRGRGIRSITMWRGRYLIAGGSYDGSGSSALYLWPGPGHSPVPRSLPLGSINPEALALNLHTDPPELLIVSDDGELPVGDCPCKQLKDASLKRFRAVIVPETALLAQ
jgi:hypothetical protein